MTAQLPPELASAFSLQGKVALVTGSTMGIGEPPGCWPRQAPM